MKKEKPKPKKSVSTDTKLPLKFVKTSLSLKSSTVDKLLDYAEKNDLSLSQVVRIALNNFIYEHGL